MEIFTLCRGVRGGCVPERLSPSRGTGWTKSVVSPKSSTVDGYLVDVPEELVAVHPRIKWLHR